MTPTEAALIKSFGTSLYLNITQNVMTWVFYGLFIPISGIAFHLFLSKGVKGYSRKILLSCMISVVLMNTWDYIVFPGSSTLLLPKYRLMLTLSGGLEAQNAAATKVFVPWGLQINWPPSIITLVGDGIVTWRAYVVCYNSKIIQYTLVIFMAANTALQLSFCVVEDLQLTFFDYDGVIARLNFASLFMSLGVNMIGTFAIGVKVWYHHRATKLLYSSRSRRFSPTVRMLLLLVESGALYCITQLLLCILTVLNTYTPPDSLMDNVDQIVDEFYNGIAAIYPMAVIIMFSLKQLPLEETFDLNSDTVINTA